MQTHYLQLRGTLLTLKLPFPKISMNKNKQESREREKERKYSDENLRRCQGSEIENLPSSPIVGIL